MSEYCTRKDVEDRLTERGFRHVVDRNQDGVSSESELKATIDTAISYAGGLIDAAIVSQGVPIAVARASGNGWLRDRAVDLVAHRAATHGGRSPIRTLKEDSDDAKELLADVRAGQRIPGLVYPTPGMSRSSRMPQAINPRA